MCVHRNKTGGETMTESFNSIKEKVLNLIDTNKGNEVTRKTNNSGAGIYMLYVDDFSDNKIIPFYIGETNDFQTRHKEHLKELLSLNRLNYEHYKHYLIKGFYDGSYKACKIFAYLVNHNCSLNNFHMIVLETIDDTPQRKEKELEYINDLYAPFLGFNQINALSKAQEYRDNNTNTTYQEFIDKDIKNLCLFYEYGYSKFNGYLANGILSTHPQYKQLSSISCYATLFQYKKQTQSNEIEQAKLRNHIRSDCHSKIVSICNDDISNFFKENKLKSFEKQRDIISALIFDDEEIRTRVNKYIKTYAKVGIDIVETLLKKHPQITLIKKDIEKAQEQHERLYRENWEINEKVLKPLVPLSHYNSHPLKDLYEEYQFSEDLDLNNVCYVNIEYTCFKSNVERDYYPEICKIDYLFLKDGFKKSRSAFIENSLFDFFENEEMYYLETNNSFYPQPFNIHLCGAYTEFPVSMEYKNGINEFTFIGKKLEKEFDVFKEIDSLIDNKTKIVYTTSGYKSTIKKLSNSTEKTPNGLLKKLIRTLK